MVFVEKSLLTDSICESMEFETGGSIIIDELYWKDLNSFST